MALTANQVPGGSFVIATSTTAQKLAAGEKRSCASICIENAGSNSMTWGYADANGVYVPHGTVPIGGSRTLTGLPATPDDLYVRGTAGDLVYWSTVPA